MVVDAVRLLLEKVTAGRQLVAQCLMSLNSGPLRVISLVDASWVGCTRPIRVLRGPNGKSG